MFGQSGLFGQPSDDPSVNMQQYQLALQYAQANPTNVQAQRQAAYWHDVIQRQNLLLSQQQMPAPMQMPQQMYQPPQPTAPAAPGVPTDPTVQAGFHYSDSAFYHVKAPPRRQVH